MSSISVTSLVPSASEGWGAIGVVMPRRRAASITRRRPARSLTWTATVLTDRAKARISGIAPWWRPS